jgi:hypothetical protein
MAEPTRPNGIPNIIIVSENGNPLAQKRISATIKVVATTRIKDGTSKWRTGCGNETKITRKNSRNTILSGR